MARLDNVDYVMGTVLPNLLSKPMDDDDRIVNFDINEARAMKLTGLPVYMKHLDKDEDNKPPNRYMVGRVHASTMNGAKRRVLMSIARSETPQANFVSRHIAAGEYRGLSLGNAIKTEMRGKYGGVVYVKTPTEVSVCKDGARFGTTINEFFPCRRSLDDYSDTDLALFTAHYRYDEKIPKNLLLQNRNHYITTLDKLVNERYHTLTNEEKLFGDLESSSSSHSCATTSLMSSIVTPAVASDIIASAPDTAAAAAAPDTAAVPAQEEAAPNATEASTETGDAISIEQLSNPKITAKLFAEERQARQKLEATLAHNNALFAENSALLEAFKAKEQLLKDEAKAKMAEQAKRIIQSFRDSAHETMSHDQMESCVAQFQKTLPGDPAGAISTIETMTDLNIKASGTLMRQNQAATHAVKQQEALLERNYYKELQQQVSSNPYSANRSSALGATLSAPSYNNSSVAAPTSFEQKFVDTSARAQQPVVAKRKHEEPAAPNSMQAPSAITTTTANWAQQEATKQENLFKHEPTYADIAHGAALHATGDSKASADGSRVPEMVWGRARKIQKNFGPKEYAPDFFNSFRKKMRLASNNTTRMELQMQPSRQ